MENIQKIVIGAEMADAYNQLSVFATGARGLRLSTLLRFMIGFSGG